MKNVLFGCKKACLNFKNLQNTSMHNLYDRSKVAKHKKRSDDYYTTRQICKKNVPTERLFVSYLKDLCIIKIVLKFTEIVYFYIYLHKAFTARF